MLGISLPSSTLSSLAILRETSDLLAQAQTRMASGRKVNSAADNPTAYFTAVALNSRAQAMNALLDGIGNAFNTLDAAAKGISALTALVESAQSVVQQAQASAATTATVVGTVAGLTAASSFSVNSGKTITFGDGTTTATVTSSGTVSVQDILDAVNTTPGLKIRAELNSAGQLRLEATGTNTIVVGGNSNAGDKAQFGLVAATTAAGTLNATRSSFAAQFDSIRSQIDQLASDSGYNGVNLLNGNSLTVTFNETATSSLSVAGTALNSSALGIAASTNGFQSDKDLQDALTGLSAAIETLGAQAAIHASYKSLVTSRTDFIQGMVDLLKSGADKLVLVDPNEESANILALQTRQQLASTALQIVARSSETVLRLLG